MGFLTLKKKKKDTFSVQKIILGCFTYLERMTKNGRFFLFYWFDFLMIGEKTVDKHRLNCALNAFLVLEYSICPPDIEKNRDCLSGENYLANFSSEIFWVFLSHFPWQIFWIFQIFPIKKLHSKESVLDCFS